MSPLWITSSLVCLVAVAIFLVRRHARLRGACPECGRALRGGAV